MGSADPVPASTSRIGLPSVKRQNGSPWRPGLRPSLGSGRARHRIITTSGLFTGTGTEGQGASPGALITRESN